MTQHPDARFSAAEAQFDLKLQSQESRIVTRLGTLTPFLLAVATAVLVLLR
jgi:hypothetical protein